LRRVPHRLSDFQQQAQVIMLKELLKLLESMRHYSWKSRVTLDEGWFCLSLFLLITNQFGSVQKTKLHKSKEKYILSEDDADGRLESSWI
jgi:glycosylphosphatidylinositol transamidase (GPIT) subunit GPI8